ncbi:class III signal peptide-containing protein [uncultured Methanobrevibacter sp.]|uniref:class III signal peptide-containing protein n=1 Tax=uncultured Methanobrevibacter sp. TaxID=253161 RepID=UPI0025CDF56C|nr:class III signal peptide-containing protein [uncultured Methanobrevibacter sp.]
MLDDRGQVSLEYILIFAVSLIILIAFTMPFLNETMSDTFDVSDSLKTKVDLSKIADAIKHVYGEGEGSKQTVSIDVYKPVKIDVSNNQISSKIKLNNNQYKVEKINVHSKLKTGTFKLNKGKNSLVVEWPVGNENMILYAV